MPASRSLYEALARNFKSTVYACVTEQEKIIARHMIGDCISALKEDNPNFSSDKFKQACRYDRLLADE